MATFLSNIHCKGGGNKNDSTSENADTVKRPSYVPSDATLLRFGSEQEPRLVWADYVGHYRNGQKVYEHILGVRFFYNSKSVDTFFFENFDIRNGKKTFDPKAYKLLYAQIDEGTLTIANDGDTLHIFSAVHGGPGPISNGVQMINVPSIQLTNNNQYYIAGSWITSYLKNEGKGLYSLILEGGEKIAYRLNNGCEEGPSVMSFINVEDGKVYFIEKSCWLEIVDTNNVSKLKNFH